MSVVRAFQFLSRTMSTAGFRSLQTIGTHDGTFHCDEALAVFLLRQLPEYERADLIRTRNPDLLNGCSVVVDVGAVYDPVAKRFDHHQRGFTESFGHGFTTKLSSAGLIYKHFGEEIISRRIERAKTDPSVQILYKKLYKEFIEGIDGIDNGVPQYPKELKPAYKVRTDLSSRVSWLNPAWNSKTDRDLIDARFVEASNLTGREFCDRLSYYADSWIPARSIVAETLTSRWSADESGKILIFESFVPWKEHLFELEEENDLRGEKLPLYVIYSDESNGSWRIQAIPISTDSFANRKSLPAQWCGLRDKELSDITSIPGCIFVHNSGFIGGNLTKDGALKMARAALTS